VFSISTFYKLCFSVIISVVRGNSVKIKQKIKPLFYSSVYLSINPVSEDEWELWKLKDIRMSSLLSESSCKAVCFMKCFLST